MAMPHRIDMPETHVAAATREDLGYQACRILQVAFVLAPIIAGLDKFFGFLVNWNQYLAPTVANMLPVAPHTFMMAVGVVEIIAGLIVAAKPYFGGYLAMSRLTMIAHSHRGTRGRSKTAPSVAPARARRERHLRREPCCSGPEAVMFGEAI